MPAPVESPAGAEVAPWRPGSGDAAARRLHALTEIAKAVAGASDLDGVLGAAAAAARTALEAASLSLSVWERDRARVRVLLNDGELGPAEESEPADEVYPVTELAVIAPLFESGVPYVQRLGQEPGMDELLRRLGKGSCLGVPVVLEARVWGELFVTRRTDQPPFTAADLDYAVAVAAQISAGVAQVQHVERVARLAYTDPLTGLANRRAVDEQLDAALARHRGSGTAVAVVVVDVNGLKRINDERGHEAGDRALVHFAGLLSAAAGTVPGSLAGRMGGDEFCILLEPASTEEALAVAEELCRRAAASLPEGVSCGVACTLDPVGIVDSAARLFRLADAAQARAKRSRSRTAVVAGRGLPEDATLRLVDQVDRTPRRGDRRRVRGRGRDGSGVVAEVLGQLDHSGAATTVARLEVVADAVARLVDGPAWWISAADVGSPVLRTVAFSTFRRTGAQLPVHDAYAAPGAEFDLGDYPLTVQALDGQGYLVETGVPGEDPAEQAILDAGGYTGVLLAGGRDHSGEGWLVEIYLDEISAAQTVPPSVLRALVAVALLPSPQP